MNGCQGHYFNKRHCVFPSMSATNWLHQINVVNMTCEKKIKVLFCLFQFWKTISVFKTVSPSVHLYMFHTSGFHHVKTSVWMPHQRSTTARKLEFLQWRNSYYQTFYGHILHFLIAFYFIYTIKCDQKAEYGNIKSSIVRISQQ